MPMIISGTPAPACGQTIAMMLYCDDTLPLSFELKGVLLNAPHWILVETSC